MKRALLVGLAMAVSISSIVLAERPFCGRFDGTLDNTPAFFEVNGNEATMKGFIDGSTPAAVRALIANNPAVDTILMDYVPGSDDDFSNIEAARLVRAAGLKTHILSNGVVSSGGVDFFLAGVVRTIDPNVCEVGVHSWAGGGVNDASKLPRSDPRHLLYLSYFRDMGIDEQFYWFTLNAAPASDIYNMDDNEVAFFGMTGNATNPAPPRPDIRIGSRGNPNKQNKNNRYTKTGAGQVLRVMLRGARTSKVFLTVENDATTFDYMKLKGSRPKRGLKVKTFSLTGGRKNVSGALARGGLILTSVDPGALMKYQSKIKGKAGSKPPRQVLQFSLGSELTRSRLDVAKVKVK